MAKDYYSTLGVSKTATDDEIKKAFRRLAHEHHPDKGGDQKKFKDINEAYQILGDKEKRTLFDTHGSAAFEQGGFGNAQNGQGFGGFHGFNQGGFDINFEDMGDLGDMLGGMFGFSGGGKKRARRGQDIQTEIAIDFLEAIHGVKKQIKLHKNTACSVCSGSGAKQGSKKETCKTCGGKGQVQKMARTMFGTMQTNVACDVCHGEGEKISDPCIECTGSGIERKTREYTVEIPSGLNDGEGVRIEREGEFPGPGGHPGDLIVRVRVKSHPAFERDEDSIISKVEIPFSTMILGGEVEIETVDGTGSLKIPEFTVAGTVFKLKGKGVPHLHSHIRGDHLVTVMPVTPKKISKEQRAILIEAKKIGL